MIQIPAVLERCAGIDVGKRELAVALITGPADEAGVVQTRLYGTTVPELEALADWLIREGCTSVAMESTGSYWIPVKNILESRVKIVLVCAKKHSPKRGDKTDFRDATNLAHLHRHGLLKSSFLAPRGIIELRDFTRRRKKLLGNLAAEKNRIQKVLEVANVKIGNIASDVFGVSGQAMVSELLSGREVTPEQVADLAKQRLRDRIPELMEALKGHHMNDHHRWLIQQSIDHAVLLDRQLEELETKIQEKLQPYWAEYELLQSIPGVKEMTAASILAGDRGGHGPVSNCETPVQLGWTVPWQQPFSGQEQEQPHQEREQVPLSRAGSGKLGRGTQDRFDTSAEVPSMAKEDGREEGQHRFGAQSTRTRLRVAEGKAAVCRT